MLVFHEWDEIGIAFNVDNKDPLIWVPIAIRVLEQVDCTPPITSTTGEAGGPVLLNNTLMR